MKKLYLVTDLAIDEYSGIFSGIDGHVRDKKELLNGFKKGLLTHKKIYELKRVTRKELLEK